jgi:hypothetical protein
MTAKQKYDAERAAMARAVEGVGRTTREEWERMIEMYENEDPEAPLVEPVGVTQTRYLSANGHKPWEPQLESKR